MLLFMKLDINIMNEKLQSMSLTIYTNLRPKVAHLSACFFSLLDNVITIILSEIIIIIKNTGIYTEFRLFDSFRIPLLASIKLYSAFNSRAQFILLPEYFYPAKSGLLWLSYQYLRFWYFITTAPEISSIIKNWITG